MFLFQPAEMRMQGGGLHAHFSRQEVILSTATSGPQKTSARKRAEKGALMTLIWGTLAYPYHGPHGGFEHLGERNHASV